MENEKLIEKIYEKRQEIFNKIQLNEFVDKKSFAYWMRINPTMAEIEMKKILDEIGERFYRQVVIEPYIVDFLYRKFKLVIEIDGPNHNEIYDKKRDDFFKNKKFNVLRFSVNDLYFQRDIVKEKIIEGLNIQKIKKENKELY